MARLQCNFLSYTLHRAVDLTVIVPTMCFGEMMAPDPHHPEKVEYPVLYLLHGYGNNHATWNGYTSLELYAEERNLCVVMLSGENMGYIDHGEDFDYFRFISRELPEFVRMMFPVSTRREDTYIAGLSMGGFGALLHGLRDSEQFAAMGAFSPAIVMKHLVVDKPENDLYEQLRLCAREDRRIPVYMACGTKDGLYSSGKAFFQALLETGFQATWDEGELDHEWRFWNLEIERFMDWLPRTDPWAGTKRRI